MQLKQQNYVIVAWIQLMKSMKMGGTYRSRPKTHTHTEKIYPAPGFSDHPYRPKAESFKQVSASVTPRSQKNYPRLITEYVQP
jgi:hypothetical protein